MLSKMKKFSKISHEEKKLFLEAYITLGMIRTTMLASSFKYISRSFEHHKELKKLLPLNDEEMKVAKLVGEAIMRASTSTPWESTCLSQALVVQKMLQKRGISGAFYLGAMKDGDSNNFMKVHAWSQCGENIITGEGGHEGFTILSMFIWQGKNARL